MLNLLKGAYATGHFKSHGFDRYIYTSFEAVNWVINTGINLRSFDMILQRPTGTVHAGKWVGEPEYVLLKAVAAGEVAIVRLMLQCGRLDFDAINHGICGTVRPLHRSILDGRLEITNMLLQDPRLVLNASSVNTHSFKQVLRDVHCMRLEKEFVDAIRRHAPGNLMPLADGIPNAPFDSQLQCVEAVLADERSKCSEEST